VPEERGEWTVRRALQWTAEDLATRGSTTARLDAELLLAHALGTTRLGLYLAHDRPLEPAQRSALRSHVERRRKGEPVAYILGRKEFYGLDFFVDGRVLVPRPETERLVDAVLEALPVHSVGGRVLDLGTGSGAVAIAVARARPTVDVDAVDLSEDALVVARRNALRHAAIRVRAIRGDLFAGLPLSARYDVVVSNPPYIATGDLQGLPVDVALWEPRSALDGGADGLALVRRIVSEAPRWLSPNGRLCLEVGAGQAPTVRDLVAAVGAFDPALAIRDYAGIERVVVADLRKTVEDRLPQDHERIQQRETVGGKAGG